MRRILLMIVAGHLVLAALAQSPGPTASFVVRGAVKREITITQSDLASLPVHTIGDVVITNHLGEKKSEIRQVQGVRLREVLQSVEINEQSPRLLSEYYFVFHSNDGYTVVYSWNEIFNAKSGERFFLVVSKDGKKLSELDDAILMLAPDDERTGRRYLKSLATVDVKRAP
ncbi:MAG: hypothetical protein ACK5DD_07710 [Cyclobacteriaceae bacterium]